jgi:hypothetical protein
MPYTTLKNAVLSEKIDWIAYSQATNLDWNYPSYIDDHWKEVRPVRGYDHGQENKQGVKRFWNVEHPSQGRFTVLPGAASATLLENQLEFLQFINTTDRKATRIDYAIDILHSKFVPKLARQHLLAGEAVTHAQTAIQTGDIYTKGDTQYVGKKSSETYTRIYDKASEQKSDAAWTRIETIYQGDRAKPSLASYCEHQSTRSLIKTHVDFPTWKDWQAIMSSPVVNIKIAPKQTATRAWLLDTVAKSMASELARDESHEFWFEWMQRVKLELSKMEENNNLLDF